MPEELYAKIRNENSNCVPSQRIALRYIEASAAERRKFDHEDVLKAFCHLYWCGALCMRLDLWHALRFKKWDTIQSLLGSNEDELRKIKRGIDNDIVCLLMRWDKFPQMRFIPIRSPKGA